MADIKNFLYAWCGKKKITPNYDIRAAGNKNRQKFVCEVRPLYKIYTVYMIHIHIYMSISIDSFNTILYCTIQYIVVVS